MGKDQPSYRGRGNRKNIPQLPVSGHFGNRGKGRGNAMIDLFGDDLERVRCADCVAFMARNCLDVINELDKAGRKQYGNA